MKLNGLVHDRRLFQVNFFPSKVPEILGALFSQVVKHSPVFVWAGLHFVSEKNKDEVSKYAQ